MAKQTRSISDALIPNRQPNRPHFVKEWAEAAGFDAQTKLADAVGADKSLVSNWYKGTTPSLPYQLKLAELFGCSRDSLFGPPDDEWVRSFLDGRSPDEKRRIRQTMETAFPRNTK